MTLSQAHYGSCPMITSDWVEQFKNSLWAKLETVRGWRVSQRRLGQSGGRVGWVCRRPAPENVAQSVYLLELKALGPERNSPLEPPD